MIHRFDLGLVGLGLVLLAACGGGAASSGASTVPTAGTEEVVGSITIHNASSYDLHQLQLTPSEESSWGPDLLAGDPLLRDETGTVPVFACGRYDLRLVDDENIECVVQDIDLCFEDTSWSIDDDDLTTCATGWAD